MYQRILVPLEREGATEAHLQHASALASQIGAEVITLRVITVVPSEDYFMQRIQVEEGSKGARGKAEAEKYMARLGKQLRDQGVVVKPEVVVSDKAEDEAIVDCATEFNCDLIVLPNQRRSLFSRWLMGNVAAKVQRRSPIPVLFVREED
jgi:nucleotide-binding universal stress UspA family protein